MGMVLIGRRLSADELIAVREDASVVTALLYGDLEDEYSDMPEPDLDIYKAWHGIHFLLTGSAWDIRAGAGEAILGGDDIGEDGGYGPARLLSPEAVERIAAELDLLDTEALRTRFDPQAMTADGIYPNSWTGEGQFEFLDYHFVTLQAFYRAAADNGQAVLLAIT